MSESSKSLYAVLGLDKSADERSVKKAYFGLVRKFPPETHPEEFKKIREAYEVLSNPQSRADYDRINTYDEYGELGGFIKSGQERMEAGDYQTAERFFHQVLAKKADLHFVRDMLGMAMLNSKRPKEALVEFEKLVDVQPANAVYWLHKGYALYNLERDDQALSCYRKARDLDGSDTRAMVAIADVLSGRKQYEEALSELQKAIDADGSVDFQDFVFFMRRLQIQLLRDRWDLAEKELESIWKILPEDEDVRKYVATRLSSIAADMFAMKKSADANKLLQWSSKLDTSRKSLGFQFPAKATLRIADLSQSARLWMEKNAKEWVFGKLQHGKWGGPILLLLLAGFSSSVLLGGLFGGRRAWPTATAALMLIWSVLATLFLGWTIAKVIRAKRSPYGAYTTIHPLHLLQIAIDKVTVWPLVNLQDVSLTHHMTNGIYSYTAVRMDFTGTVCSLTINGQQAAVDWANQLLGQRRRVLELMSMGLLDAEEGYDIVPPTELAKQKRPKTESAEREEKRDKKFYSIFATAGLALGVIAIPYNRGVAERADWRMCDRHAGISSCRSYLQLHAGGKHAGEAADKIAKLYESALSGYASKQKGAKSDAVAVIGDIIEKLKTSPSQRILVTYDGSVDFSSTKAWNVTDVGGKIVPANSAFSETSNRSREGLITSSMKRAFTSMFGYDAIDIAEEGGGAYYQMKNPVTDSHAYKNSRDKGDWAPIRFVVKYHVAPSGTLYESTTDTTKKMFGILIEWTFGVYFEGDDKARYSFSTVSKPAPNISYTTSSYGDRETYPYTKMAESAFENFAQNLAANFGITITGDSGSGYGGYGGKYGKGSVGGYERQKKIDEFKTGYGGKSSYGGYSGYGGLSGSDSSYKPGGGSKLDPELQKKIDEIMKANARKNTGVVGSY